MPMTNTISFLSNYHRPLMGTFHAKLLLVDRQVALVNSNNIQDRPNIESCVRLEGDIVNSVYDHALISWGNTLNPPLRCLGSPAPKTPSPAAFTTGENSTLPAMTATKLRELANVARMRLRRDDQETEDLEEKSREPFLLGGQRRLSFADVMDGVMRRDGAGHITTTSPSNGTAAFNEGSSHTPPNKEISAAEKDRLAKHAGSEWARKVLGERFHFSHLSGPSSPTMSSSQEEQSPTGHNKRHFADVVASLMEKEGIKPALWAEGALDTFGLGPSSSRNVSDEAKRSRSVAKSAQVHVPQIVLEEDHNTPADESVTVDDMNQDRTVSPCEVTGEDNNEADTTSRSESTNVEAVNMSEKVASQDQNFLQSNSGGGEEGAPGAQAFQRRLHRTTSTMSKASASERLAQITKSLDFANLSQVKGEITAEQLLAMTEKAAKDLEDGNESESDVLLFNPFIFHTPHAPVPMALVNRRPHGTPGHSDIRNPQDAAWLAGFRYAKNHIFLQTPTLNATPIKHAILHAARRHVRIEVYLGLGFNDKSESMPFQGGTNEKVVTRLYRQLRREGKGDEKFLEVYCEWNCQRGQKRG